MTQTSRPLSASVSMMKNLIKRFSTDAIQSKVPLGDTKISDVKGTIKKFPDAGRSVYDRYCRRYLNSNSRRVGPLIHLGLLCGGLGYVWEYPHLSKYILLNFLPI